jgi:hypothetical protein
MKKIVLIALAFVCCISHGCKQAEFKTVHGKKANYSVSFPADYTDSLQLMGERPNIDLEYGNSKGESIQVAVVDIPTDDTIDHLKQLVSASDSEFIAKVYAGGKILERRIIDVNGINSYFAYFHTEKLYYQMLFQFNNGKMLNMSCAYHYKNNDSLKQYYYQVITSIAWAKE